MFTGPGEAMLEDAAALRGVGVNHLIAGVQRPAIEQAQEMLHRFGEDVVRKALS